MKNFNPEGRPSERLGKQYRVDEFKGPVPCPNCGGKKFAEEKFMELWVHQIDSNVQIQKHYGEIFCKLCGVQVNLKGEKIE